MSIDSIVNGLTHDQKIQVMEMIWQDLILHSPGYSSPPWHAEVLAERLAHPSSEPRLTVDESRTEIMERLHARRTQS